MPELLYRCPVTKKELALGISVDGTTFETANFDYCTIECPHCGQQHQWCKEDVYLQVPPELDRKNRQKKLNPREQQG